MWYTLKEPYLVNINNSYSNNTALIYGPNIAGTPFKIVKVLSNGTVSKYQVSDFVPGSKLEDIKLAVMDKYGQIIYSDNSTLISIKIKANGGSITPICSYSSV